MLSVSSTTRGCVALLLLLLSFGVSACSGGAVGGGNAAQDSGTAQVGDEKPAPSSRVVFVTRNRYAGYKLGGTQGADDKCRVSAVAAGLSGTFQAWLSTSSVDAIDRVPDGGPWHSVRRTDIVFVNRDAWGGYPQTTAAIDESGSRVAAVIWTGTAVGGSGDADCNDWTDENTVGVVGNAESGVQQWTNSGKQQCVFSASLLCYQVD